jgi:hypothetical protein
MKSLESILEAYFSQTGQLEPPMGQKMGERKERKASKEANDALAKTLDERRKLAGRIAVLVVILASLLFGCLLLAPFYYCKSGNPYLLIAPVGVLGLLGWILSYLRWLSIDLDRLALLMSILHNLPPEKAASFITEFRWNVPRRGSQKKNAGSAE